MKPQGWFVALGLAIAAGDAGAEIHGPIVQWWDSPESRASVRWVETGGATGAWLAGKSGFGYGDADDATVLAGMEGRHREVSIRREFDVPAGLPDGAALVLLARYDDAFEAWIDGREAARRNLRVVDGRMQVVAKHEADGWEEIGLEHPGAGRRVLAATGYNDGLQSSDFTLDLKLVARWDGGERVLIPEGAEWQYALGKPQGAGWRKNAGAVETRSADEPPRLSYRVRGAADWTTVDAVRSPLAKSAHQVASVELEGLPAASVIELRLGDRRVDFRTAPDAGDGLAFVTGGDMYHDRKLLDAMNARAGAEDPVFALLGGDLAYTNNQNPERWLEWIDSWAAHAVTPDGRQVPMVVVIGNHEVIGAGYRPDDAPGPEAADEFFSLFRTRETGRAYQTLDFRIGLSLVLLDSGHAAKVSEQTAWLDAALGQRAAKGRILVCYHRPAWGCGTKEDAVAIQRAWCPLFEKHGVAAVFENDHHVHSRSRPLLAGRVDEARGIPYLGAGAWGVVVRDVPKNVLEKRPWLAAASATNHLYRVEVDGKAWSARAMRADGSVFDEVRREWPR